MARSNTDTAKNEFGRRLIPHIVDECARTKATEECFSIPRSSDPSDGWKPVTWKEFANAVNWVAHRIIKTVGHAPAGEFPTVAYIGPNDVRYHVLTLAAIKTGYKILFISPRNSQEGQINLFRKTDCHNICFPRTHRGLVQPWLEEREMRAIEVGSLEEWFAHPDVEHYPYEKTWEEAEWEPFVVLHTSGSTGLPKPVVALNGMLAISDKYNAMPDWEGRKFWLLAMKEKSKRILLPMPLFHAAGLYASFVFMTYYSTPVAYGLSDKPLSSDSAAGCIEHADVDGCILPPAILEDMSQDDAYIKLLSSKLKYVSFGGGNLVRNAGNRLISNGVRIINLISATEFLPFPMYEVTSKEDWQYFVLNDELFGADWREVDGEDEVYQLVIVRKDKNPGLQGFFYTFPNDDEYDTRDLYQKHPTLPNHWLYHGRSDNIIVFSNGEKLNPVSIEETIEDHAEVKGALVVGAGRFQPGLILEPVTQPATEAEAKELIDRVWPLVVRANKETVAHGQIGREFMMLSHPEKPFPRAGKGTIQRALAIKLYKDDIDALYERTGQTLDTNVPRLDVKSEEALTESLREIFSVHLGREAEVDPDADFFSAGIDSMQVIKASRLIRGALEAAGLQVDAASVATRVIYGNPTPRRLARYLLSLVRHDRSSNEDGEEHEIQAMKDLWEKYSRHPTAASADRPDAADNDQVVLLTGSTGALGSYILDQMVRNTAVKQVVCLNRAEDGGEKQQARAMKDRGLSLDYASKCIFLHVDMSRHDFGLPRETYNELLSKADRFIHNAWPVNFNIPVESFDPHIRSVRNVADFAADASKRVAVGFISSIGTGDRWDTSKGLLPERRLEDLTLPSGGYGRSKLVGSLILEDVAKAGNFPAATIRVGQIAGPEGEKGVWNKQEWLPSIIASSLYLHALPKNLGGMERVDWTAIESVAGLVLDVMGISQQVPAEQLGGYYHAVNPSSTTWSALAPAVQEFYGRERIAELISFNEWVERLDQSQTNDTRALDKNPGVKLLDSYRGMASAADPVVFDMKVTKERSPSSRKTRVVSPELMKHWCKQWNL